MTHQARMSRRQFVQGTTAASLTAASYARVLGANDRLGLGIIGCGGNGRGHVRTFLELEREQNAAILAVCDLWTGNMNRGAAMVREQGSTPATHQYYPDLLARADIDAVLMSTADHHHVDIIVAAIEAGKDVYAEKPLANTLQEAQRAYRAVTASDRIVQLGTQSRSDPRRPRAAEMLASGILGDITRVEISRWDNGPRWTNRPETRQVLQDEVDWKFFLRDLPFRAWDPRQYMEWRLYPEFSNGIMGLLLPHDIDLVHHLMGDLFPHSAVAQGGIYAWPDGRRQADTLQVTYEYPRGYQVSFSMMFGNRYNRPHLVLGKHGTLEIGADGFQISGRGGSGPGQVPEIVTIGAPGADRVDVTLEHHRNFLQCVRERRQPNAPILAGYAHAVASVMAVRAQQTGMRQYWDPAREEIVTSLG